MAGKKNYGTLVQDTIDAILKENTPEKVKRDFNIKCHDQIDALYQNYLFELACEKLKGDRRIMIQQVDDMPFSVKVKNILKTNGIKDMTDLVNCSYGGLNRMGGLGQISAKEIEHYLAMLGLQIKKEWF